MATIETEFIKRYPQHRKAVEEEMKFGNVEQQEAEVRIARKNNLRHTAMNRTEQGRWIKMLKVAAPVVSTTAGIESKPRYGKKKKEDEEDELE